MQHETPQAQPTVRDQLDHLLGVARRSVRYAPIVAIVAILGVAASVAFAMMRPHAYRSETVMLYQETIPASMFRDSSASSRGASFAVQFREMLYSRPQLAELVNEFELYPDVVAERGIDTAVEELQSHIEFRERGGTFRIGFVGSDPELAQAVTKRLAERMMEWQEKIQLKSVNAAKDFFVTERKRAERSLQKAEVELAEFIAAHPEFAFELSPAGPASNLGASIRAQAAQRQPVVRTRNVRPGSRELRALERQRGRLRARLEELPGERAAPAAPEPSREVVVAKEALRRARAEANKKELELTEQHPDLIAARRRVAEARRRLGKAIEADRAETGLGVPAHLMDSPREELEAKLAKISQEIEELERRRAAALEAGKPKSEEESSALTGKALVTLEAEWARLLRAVEEARQRYDVIEQKSYGAEIVAASEVSRHGTQLIVLDPAYLPTRPAGTSRKFIVGLGGLGACLLGLMIGIGLGVIDDRVFSKYDADRVTAGPILAVVPKKERKRV